MTHLSIKRRDRLDKVNELIEFFSARVRELDEILNKNYRLLGVKYCTMSSLKINKDILEKLTLEKSELEVFLK